MRQHLIAAAIRAIERDGPQVSMREIAAEAQVPKPTIYRFFSGKAELATALGDQVHEEYLQRLLDFREDPDRTLEDLVTAAISGYAELIERNPNVFRFLVTGSENTMSHAVENSRTIAAEIGSLISVSAAAFGGEIVDPHFYSSLIVGSVSGAADWWMTSSPNAPSLEEFVTRLAEVVRNVLEMAARTAGIEIDFSKTLAELLAETPVDLVGRP